MSINSDKTEIAMFRKTVQRFASDHIEGHYEDWEKSGIFPRRLWRQLGEAGLLCVDMPEEYGGFDADFSLANVIYEEFSRLGYTSLYGATCVHSGIVAHYILNAGSGDQKRRYLSAMATGELVGAVAMTEPNAGSDLQGIRATAREDGDSYVLNGSKIFISNGQHCDFVIVVARTNFELSGSKGISLFLVDAETEGFSRGRNLDKLGQHSADTSELFFDEVRIPKHALLGQLGRGFNILMQELPRERMLVATAAVAATEGVMQWTIDYVRERQAFGQAISEFQNTRFRIAEMQTELRLHQSFIRECIELLSLGELDAVTASMAKLSTTEMQCRVIDGCLQLFGGYGYMMEYPIARAYIDARAQRIYAGTSEIMKEIIGRSLLRE